MFKFLGISENTNSPFIYIDNYEVYTENKEEIDTLVKNGKHLILSDLPIGKVKIVDTETECHTCPMLPIHFAEINENNPLMKSFKENDFKYFTNKELNAISPLAEKIFIGKDFNKLLGSVSVTDDIWTEAIVSGKLKFGKGSVVVNLLNISNMVEMNPIVQRFMEILLIK